MIPKEGDERYVAEWMTEIGWIDPATNEVDPDKHKYGTAIVAALENGLELANSRDINREGIVQLERFNGEV
jgi:hypothetical protein